MKQAVTLKKNYEFRRLYQKGTSAVGSCMVVYCRKNRLDHNRLGLTASMKLGNAVKRNRARRRLREVYRLNAPRLCTGYDVILVARSRTLTASWKELSGVFVRLCGKLGLIQKSAAPSSPAIPAPPAASPAQCPPAVASSQTPAPSSQSAPAAL